MQGTLDNIIEVLSAHADLTPAEIVNRLSSKGADLGLSQVVSGLLAAERQGIVQRLRDETFDELSPLTTARWRLTKSPDKAVAEAVSVAAKTTEVAPEEQLRVVASQPIFAFPVIEKLKEEAEILEVREAIEKVVIDSEQLLRVICPYYDNLFLDVLHRNMEKVQKLKQIRIISEQENQATARATALFPNIRVKYLFKATRAGGAAYPSKLRGVHAKVLIADEAEALVGSFNLTFNHILYSFDLGLLIRGKAVPKIVRVFDALWELPEED